MKRGFEEGMHRAWNVLVHNVNSRFSESSPHYDDGSFCISFVGDRQTDRRTHTHTHTNTNKNTNTHSPHTHSILQQHFSLTPQTHGLVNVFLRDSRDLDAERERAREREKERERQRVSE